LIPRKGEQGCDRAKHGRRQHGVSEEDQGIKGKERILDHGKGIARAEEHV